MSEARTTNAQEPTEGPTVQPSPDSDPVGFIPIGHSIEHLTDDDTRAAVASGHAQLAAKLLTDYASLGSLDNDEALSTLCQARGHATFAAVIVNEMVAAVANEVQEEEGEDGDKASEAAEAAAAGSGSDSGDGEG